MSYDLTDTDELPSEQRPARKVPKGFTDAPSFLEHMRKEFQDDLDSDKLNRDAGLEDLQFYVSDQWDEGTRARRQAAFKPCLTINRLPAFVSQIVGTRRLNETVIKILPDNGGTQPVARIREGLVRSIQKISRADIAYDKALENQVICGVGNFQVYLDYETDDVFEQKICVAPIPDAFAVVWDRMSSDPTGSDAGHCFVVDTIPRPTFKDKYPWASAADMTFVEASVTNVQTTGWVSADDVRIVSYWRVLKRKRTLALMKDGSTQDITDDNTPETLANIVQRQDGSPIMREVDRKYVEMTLCTGTDILEDPYELEISRVPVFRVPGWEVHVGPSKHRWGLVRFMKDPQRFHNFMRSAAAERLMLSPRGVWVADQEAVAGREAEWRQSHLTDDTLLIKNSGTNTPERMAPAQIEEAMLTMAELSAQDLKDVSNIHEANLGMPSNEVSGAAIQARQRVSDTGTILYHDNLNLAIEEAGRVINELVPLVYDTPRVIKVLGEDAREDLQVINAMDNPQSVDITAGKYSVSVTTGPSYQTKRVEAQQGMVAFINAAPQVAGYTLDLVAESMDWPKHEEFARRIRMMLPPGIVDPRDMTPEMQQRAAAQGQAQQQQAQLEAAAAQAKIQNETSQAAVNFARAKNFEAESEAVPQKTASQQTQVASQAADREARNHLEAIRVATGQ